MIKNFEKLASSALRRQALNIAEAGLKAINTTQVVQKQFAFGEKQQTLRILKQRFNLKPYKRIICVGFGKAALEAVTAIQGILKNKISCGFVIDLKEGSLGNIACRAGSHPFPTKVNLQATKELVALLEGCTEEDLVICVVSGGGSALLCYPQELSCEAESAVIAALNAKGATIFELDTVRKHISRVKGGNLAKIIYPATCISLIFSDVPGDDLSVVASGPTVLDGTTARDAAEILKKYDVLEVCQLPACRLVETPKDKKYFSRVHNILFVSARLALAAMRQEAESLGWQVRIFSDSFQGEAKSLGAQVAGENKKGECLLGAGESTVKVLGQGLGGRNQEMALGALGGLEENQVLLCLASDGHDNTDAAGALVDLSTFQKARRLGLDPQSYLRNNDSYHFFEAAGELLFTGPTGSNVADLFVGLRE